MLNVLSTDETSQPIRPNYRSFNQAKIDDICAYYYEGKIFFSAAEGSKNDIIFIYDLERNNWVYKWDKGVKAFLEYTESNTATNASHFLAVPASGNRLWEISEKIESDFGQPFLQSYISPLIPVSKDKTDIMKTKESLIELGRQKGNLTYEILGIEADKGFSVLGSRSIISSAMSNSGPSTDLASDFLASDTNNIPTTFTQATSKKAIKIRKKVYAVQHKIYTSSLGAKFTILSIQTKGRLLPKRTPRSWLK